jgi:hypothetical protein
MVRVIFFIDFSYVYIRNDRLLGVKNMPETGLSYLVEESLGKQWYFTLSDQNKIQYTCRENGAWTEAVPIDSQIVKFFRAAIDKRDRIYLLAYALSKQLIYYEWDGDQWYHRILYRITSRFENISYVEVLSAASRIHLLYYIENSLKRAQESFVHSYFEDGRWKSDVLMNYLTDQNVVPQMACRDEKGNLICIYTSVHRNQTQCHLVRFDSKNSFWSKPAVLFQKSVKCSSFNGFTDSSGMMHMVWQEEAGEQFSLYYKKIDTEALNFSGTDVCIREGNSSVQYPSIFSGNGYHCCWIHEGRTMISHADPLENHWDAEREMTDKPMKPYMHVYKQLDGQSVAVMELGDGSPDFERTARKTIAGGQSISEKQKKDAGADSPSRHSSQKIGKPESSVLQDMRELSEKVDQAAARMEEFYTALYQLQDYMRQKDKSFFQIDTQIRKLTFELDQLRSAKGSGRARTLSNVPVHTDENSMVDEQDKKTEPGMENEAHTGNDANKEAEVSPRRNIDRGSGEIQLGNVNILINPEEEA